ncbi:hypothetical protein CEP54_002822 [Fusarium duplospermum]|uniref:MARVEL domain-containing protein n=1 Tax=Fusarium duplospermum TaxID=1325734 RepID=A0A428QSZ1_9HYPO|nr:hypothetical protein CEP54_002822 [Fusarium duplospermum]
MARIKVPLSLLLVEMFIALTVVILFGLAYPDRFRSRLWENGGEEGWNSNPNKRIYFYANHQEPPEVPYIWQKRLTESNLGIAILTLVIFLARATLYYTDYLSRYISVIYDVVLLWLWSVSIANQSSGDLSDPKHPSPLPWYLTRSCSRAWEKNRGYCRIAQASFAVSILAAALYGARLLREALLVAYERGWKHGQVWSGQDADEEMGQEIGDKYMDDEHEAAEALMVPRESWQDQALSPVLAFFPSDR